MHDGSNMISIGEVEAALDATAEWLIAVYGARLASVHLTLEGYYSRDQVFHGLLPLVERAAGETRDTLPLREVSQGSRGGGLHPVVSAGSHRPQPGRCPRCRQFPPRDGERDERASTVRSVSAAGQSADAPR